MERREKSKYIAVVRDPELGSYAYREVTDESGVLKNIDRLKKLGVKESNIDLLPVKDPKKISVLSIIGIACTVIDLALFVSDVVKKRKKKKNAAKEVQD